MGNRQAAVNYLSWTFLGRRLLQNPSYYGLHSRSEKDVATHLSRLVDAALERDLVPSLVSEEADGKLHVTKLGSLAVQRGLGLETARRLPELLRPDLQPMVRGMLNCFPRRTGSWQGTWLEYAGKFSDWQSVPPPSHPTRRMRCSRLLRCPSFGNDCTHATTMTPWLRGWLPRRAPDPPAKFLVRLGE